MKLAQDIIFKPVITEKSMAAAQERKYTFRVAKDANKIEIKKACEELFGIEVAKVNVIPVRGQKRRQGMAEGRTASWKKAIVTVTPDSKTVEFFDGLM